MIVRVPLAESAEESCRRQHRTIEMLARDERIPVTVRRLFPAPLADGQFEGQEFFAETTLSGEVGRLYYSRPERRFDRAQQKRALQTNPAQHAAAAVAIERLHVRDDVGELRHQLQLSAEDIRRSRTAVK